MRAVRTRSSCRAEPLEPRRLLAGLTGQYFDRVDFTELKLERADATVDFSWGTTAPAAGMGANYFSVRWLGQVEPQHSEDHTFYVNSDDGVRLWVDGRLLIDNWVVQPATEKSASIALQAGQRYDIRLDYHDDNYGALARLSWSSPSQPKQVIPSSRLFSSPTGLKATYYDNADFTGPLIERTDSTIDFDWSLASPDPEIGADTFSARWSGQVVPQHTQTYRFFLSTDADAVARLRIDGMLIVDNTSVQDLGEIALEAGKRYDLLLEYTETAGPANVKLEWSSPSQAKQVIPSSRLFAADATAIRLRRADYTNPVYNNDRPDPGVIYANGAYWMVHTTGGPNTGWPLYRSTDMTSWTLQSHLLNSTNKPAFMSSAFWAPEIHKIGSQYVITGTAHSTTYGHLVIALGRASEITGPYTVQATPIVNDIVSTLDSNLFVDHDGRVYLLWKRDSNSGSGVNGSIRIREMNSAATAFAPGSTETLILNNSVGGWERNLAEAPWMIRRGDFYYLFYSGGRFNDLTYAVGVARATSPLGPFTRYSLNPILSNNSKWGGAGHGGFTLDRDGTLWHLYHARYVDNPSYGRVQVLDRLLWTADNWPTFGNNKTPTTTMQPGPRVFADSGAGRLALAGTATDDVFVISRSVPDASLLEVRRNDVLLESMPYDQIETLTLSAAGGNDILILDASRGNVIPGAGVTFTGGAGIDTVHLIGQSAQEALRLRAGVITAGTGILTHSGAERLMLEDGTFHFDNAIANFEVYAGEGAQLHFHAAQQLAALTLSGDAAAAVDAGGANGLVITALSIAPTARLDLNDNDLIVDYDSVSPIGIWTGDAYDGVTGLIQAGRVFSSGASGTLQALAIAEAREALGITGTQTATFAGRSVDSTAVLVKFTWGGDANLDGKINIDDYGRIDGNVSQSGSVWGYFNGDFNLDGKINIDDYGIIDGNIGQQDGVVL